MFEELKQSFKTFIQEQTDLPVEDNGVYRETFPFLMLRLSNIVSHPANDVVVSDVSFTLDIFSTFTGEKEILVILEQINNPLLSFIKTHSLVQSGYLHRMTILDDNETGPVRKHGVAVFTFRLAGGYEDA